MSELLQTLAFLFKRKGTTSMTKQEFKHAASLDLRWFAPADAKDLLEHALRLRLLEADARDAEAVRPVFDVEDVEVAFNFKPTRAVLTEHVPVPERKRPEPARGDGDGPAGAAAESGLVDRVAREAASASQVPVESVLREVQEEKVRAGGLLTEEVAALVVARRRGVDVTAYAEEAYATLK